MAPLILLLLFWGPVWGFTAFILAAVGLSANEFFGMSHPEDRVARAIGVVLTLGLSGVVYGFGDDARALLTLLAVLPIASLLLGLARLGDVRTSGSRMAATTFGPLWLGTLTLLALLRRDKGAEGSGYVLMAIMFAWLADTGGYFAGRFLGRHKLYEAVSPKKTVEGLVGALVGGHDGGRPRTLLVPAGHTAARCAHPSAGGRLFGSARRFGRIAAQARGGGERLGRDRAWSRRQCSIAWMPSS